MSRKLHTVIKSRLLAVLFLFFNCVCTATPVVQFASGHEKEAVSPGLTKTNVPAENEEDVHAPASFYVNHIKRFSVPKQYNRHVQHSINAVPAFSFSGHDPRSMCCSYAGLLPVPGYYSFLFRYKLF